MPPPLRISLLENPPRLLTARLVLRPLEMTDAAGLLALRGDPDVVRYMGVPPLADLERAESLARQSLSEQDRYESCTWAITLPGEEQLIGTLYAFKFDEHHRKVEIGYSLLPAHWRRGYTSEAVQALMDWLYTEMGAHRLTAEIDPDNVASAALLRKLGFRKEAYFREAYLVGENYTDSEIYCRLRTDGV